VSDPYNSDQDDNPLESEDLGDLLTLFGMSTTDVPDQGTSAPAGATVQASDDLSAYDVSDVLKYIADPGVFTKQKVDAVWTFVRNAIADASPALQYHLPSPLSEKDIINIVTFFIIYTASSRQSGESLISIGNIRVPVKFFINGSSGNLRQFLRYYSKTAINIMIATPSLRVKQAAHYLLHDDLARYAFDFVNERDTTLTAVQQATLRSAIDRKLYRGNPVDDVYQEADKEEQKKKSEIQGFLDAPLTTKPNRKPGN